MRAGGRRACCLLSSMPAAAGAGAEARRLPATFPAFPASLIASLSRLHATQHCFCHSHMAPLLCSPACFTLVTLCSMRGGLGAWLSVGSHHLVWAALCLLLSTSRAESRSSFQQKAPSCSPGLSYCVEEEYSVAKREKPAREEGVCSASLTSFAACLFRRAGLCLAATTSRASLARDAAALAIAARHALKRSGDTRSPSGAIWYTRLRRCLSGDACT